jgi:hypothetical protein
MKTHKAVTILSWLITALALVAAGAGVLWQGGNHYDFTTLRGEIVQMQGGGLYRFESVSGAAQLIGGDLVTLFVAIPLLVVAILLYRSRSLRGKLLLAGTLAYFLYTYTSLAMLAAYNELFLVYVALFSMSLFAFVMTLMEIDVPGLPARFSNRFPRRSIAGFALFLGAVLTLMWLGRIVPALISGTPPFGLESYTTLVIQVLDLGIIVPVALVAGLLLLKRSPFGYLLAAIVLVKGFSMGAAVSAMAFAQVLAGIQVSVAEATIFPPFTLVDVMLAVLMLRSLKEVPTELAQPRSDDVPQGTPTASVFTAS